MDKEFADVPSEGAGLEIDQALERLSAKGDKSSASQPEKKEVAKPSQSGEPTKDNNSAEQTPFHKHPRWIQTQKELKETREKLAAIESAGKQNQPVALPDWWKKQYGETPESLERYKNVTQKDGELDWLKQNILGEIEQRSQQEASVTKQGEEYVNTQLAEMNDEGLKFDKNSLLKFMVDFQKDFGSGALLDAEGNYDFRKSLSLMQKMQPTVETPNPRKNLPNIRGKSSTEKQSTIPVLSRNLLRRGNWRDAETK